jgi:AraC-like DNA-binding protein
MAKLNQLKEVTLTKERSLKTLVENRTAYTLEKCELNVFETSQPSALIPLTFNDFVVTSMLRGKKVMHLFNEPGFDYLPGESVLVPAGITMKIDFPLSGKENPTQCIALAIDKQKIEHTLAFLNERYPRMDQKNYWKMNNNNYHFQNSVEITGILNKIIHVCSGDNPLKDILADLSLQELIVNIVQLQNKLDLQNNMVKDHNSNPLSFIAGFIKANIQEDIKLGLLSKQACMSKTTFYRSFKKEFGISPLEYILSEKIKNAKKLLGDRGLSIKKISLESGFNDVNYFVRLFKKMEGITPGQYQLLLQNHLHN